jgi:hypothetical protein
MNATDKLELQLEEGDDGSVRVQLPNHHALAIRAPYEQYFPFLSVKQCGKRQEFCQLSNCDI